MNEAFSCGRFIAEHLAITGKLIYAYLVPDISDEVQKEIDAEEARTIAALYRDASEAAAIAIAGLRSGLFVIPTHEHLLEDARARFREIERGFDLLLQSE